MSSDDVAIRVRELGKCYHIYPAPRERLKQFVLPRLQVLAGRTPQRYFREFWALRDVSFEIAKGESVGIVGRNGSGKSTLLQLICGTLAPTAGSIETAGRIAALLELGSGFNPEFTGVENLYVNAAVLGLAAAEINERFDDIAAFADIGEFLHQPVKTYSSGMIVRLAFAIQAMIDPEILIIDEALAVGDELFQRKCFARLEKLKSEGTTILFVSHAANQTISFCERAILLEGGRCVMQGRPTPVVRSYERLLHASPSEHAKLLKQFEVERDGASDHATGGVGAESMPEQAAPEPQDGFDGGLVPQSTVSYPARGARIERIEIQDSDGRAVNLLRPLQQYRLVMRGLIMEDLRKISFAMHLRSVSGVVIFGQRYPAEGQFVENLAAGTRFELVYPCKMALLPDTYFAGGGIWSVTEPYCVHRLMDATVFRVQTDGQTGVFGYCNLAAGPAHMSVS